MSEPPDTDDLRSWVLACRRLDPVDDVERVAQLGLLEELKAAAAGAQARIELDFEGSQRAEQVAAGVPARELGAGIAAQVGLARRESPHKGSRLLGLAHALEEMPHAFRALTAGELSEWRATVLARETGCLSRADRGRVDAEQAARPGGLGGLGDRAMEREARAVAYRLDPHACTARARRAEAQRCVTVRPAPDTMTYLTGLLPVRAGVAVYAALTRHADSLRSQGDQRSRGQIMADTLVERVTGLADAARVPVEVHLVMSDQALLGDDPAPARVDGYGPVPAPWARAWLADPDTAVWVRRLYAAPDTGQLVAMESKRRVFTGLLRRFVGLRDQTCRTPWCDAPIRHLDHPVRAADGGPTTAVNAQGLCEACNQAKEAPGWRTRLTHTKLLAAPIDRAGLVATTTPTGHTHRTRPPPGPTARPPTSTRMDLAFDRLILTA